VVRNNPNFRPKSYNNVPPPAGLNNGTGRGRPNGNRGGNAPGGRGRGSARGRKPAQAAE
jgi:5'-3' exoribonuclease 1